MGVDFHWRSGGTEVRPRQPRPSSLARRLLILSLGIAGGTALVLWLRAQGLRSLQRDLQACVDAEVLALQTGQREAFLECLDASYGPWLRYHRQAFARQSVWYAERPHLRAQVVAVYLEGNQALARVRPQEGGGGQATWYFRRNAGAWRQSPPTTAAVSTPMRIVLGTVTLLCQEPDATLVRQQASDLERYISELAKAVGLPSRPQASLDLHIFPYGAAYAGDTLPSPLLGLELFTEAELCSTAGREIRLALARLLLAQRRDEGRSQPSRDGWLRDALACWYASYWDPSWGSYVAQAVASGAASRWLAGEPVASPPAALYWELRGRATEPLWIEPLAYTLGDYLARTFPSERLAQLSREQASGGSSASVRAVLGMEVDVLERAWLDDIRGHFPAEQTP